MSTASSEAHEKPPPSQHKRPEVSVSTSPNARSKTITMASGKDTGGELNCHPFVTTETNELPTFRVGVSEDRNRRCRRTMEDSHSFIYDYGGVPGQGYFAVFDGHAGKHAAEWCGSHFHEYLLETLQKPPTQPSPLPIPDLLNETFLAVDNELSKLAEAENTHSGCTAVVAFLRIEDDDTTSNSHQHEHHDSNSPSKGSEEKVADRQSAEESSDGGGGGGKMDKVKGLLEKMKSGSGSSKDGSSGSAVEHGTEGGVPKVVKRNRTQKRVLYTANVGDARAVISRRGKAVRLTYDHKGSDQQEAKRITDAGGFVMNNRVNGVLAVTRALGDASVKEFVVGNPYTTETRLDDGDEFLIVACDGLWDVVSDEEAVKLIRGVEDPQEASKILLDHALANFTTDNLSGEPSIPLWSSSNPPC
ncbi:phosphatase 2C-like domain-containing protein [Mrakia frigida]|uniref:type 2C protein phosphatase PTC1 n=1 Tax=Mrakia frigida TaxID=29902 RepID=UPI003FCC25F5